MTINYYLKEPKKEESLILIRCRLNGTLIKLSTRHRVVCATWNVDKQRCVVSKSRFPESVNDVSTQTNSLLYELRESIVSYTEGESFNEKTTSPISVKEIIEYIIDSIISRIKKNNEKVKQTPIDFFKDYIEQKRIDPHTGRYISERTKVHQRTVIHRLESFLAYTGLPNDFSTFTSTKFDAQFTEWCYSVKNYKQNTVYATYGVLKPLLNAAKSEGFNFPDTYKNLKGKCNDVDSIYLTEDEIERIYRLDISQLVEEGEIDEKSMIETSRDLFIVSCWTGLRRSDINQLQNGLFNVENKTITITAEKTKKPVVIPMHPFILDLWKKYDGHFPHLCDKGKTNKHLRECARHAKIDSEVRIVENRGGKVKTLTYLKYQLVGMHTGRRSFATNMYRRRFPTIAIMKLTGHTTESNFLKYIKVTPEENAVMMSEEFFKIMKPFE